jgi:hypothetical protein
VNEKLSASIKNFRKFYKISDEIFNIGENPYSKNGARLNPDGRYSLLQLLDQKTGLYKNYFGNVFIVKSNNYAENGLGRKNIYIKTGTFTYKTAFGTQNIVPAFKELNVKYSRNEKWFVK